MFSSLQQSGTNSAPWGYMSQDLLEQVPQTTTFRDNEYIQKLNYALQLETLAVKAFTHLQRLQGDGFGAETKEQAAERSVIHQHGSRQVIRLIVAQRGIPEERPSHFDAMLRAVSIQASDYMPSALQRHTIWAIAGRIERQLHKSYRRILEIAPAQDRDCLRELLES